eukprot:Gb_34022 [translate_table: standard]
MNGPLETNHATMDGLRLFESEEEELEGQAQAWGHIFAFVESLAVKCAALLGIPDIIARHGPRATLSLPQIAESLPSKAPDVGCLLRIMRFLVSKNVFTSEVAVTQNGVPETRYGLTPSSKWLLKHNQYLSMRPMLLMQNDKRSVAPWHHFNECVLEGGIAFERANGADIWSYASKDPEYNHLFNDAMACNAKMVMKAILSKYDGFTALNSLVDVGGGIGTGIAEIVSVYPHIRGINYDLPHVVATAPPFPGVEHIGGDMFASVPSADAVFMKWIMHDWNDEDCIKILKECRKAIPEDRGKVIIADVVLNEEGRKKRALDPVGLVFDLVMVAHSSGGKERTEEEWRKLLSRAGFNRYNIITIPALQSIIEAFPS